MCSQIKITVKIQFQCGILLIIITFFKCHFQYKKILLNNYGFVRKSIIFTDTRTFYKLNRETLFLKRSSQMLINLVPTFIFTTFCYTFKLRNVCNEETAAKKIPIIFLGDLFFRCRFNCRKF